MERAPGEGPDAFVEVLLTDGHDLSYVVFAVVPASEAAVDAAEGEARRCLSFGSAADWCAA